jgi:serine/threonine-protein kinase
MILGTAAYMSPEQAKGFPADHRSDVFSFGVVLYEMLTGRQPFRGETAPDILASVLARDPDLHTLPPNLNPRLLDLVRRCLEKTPKRRWQAMGDVRAELETIVAQPHAAPASVAQPAAPPRPKWQRVMPIGITAVVFAVIGGLIVWNVRPVAPQPIMRSVFTLPDGQAFTNIGRQLVAMSPDGSRIAYVANSRLYLRLMSELEAKAIPGTESEAGVLNPVFSPDGQSIAFWSGADETIKRISVGGGAPVTVCEATRPYGIRWQEDMIVFGQGSLGISRVPASGGKPEVLVSVKSGELAYGPQILPGGQGVLFTLARGGGSDRWDKAQIVVQRLSSGERTTLIEGGSDARYVSTGHLVYALGNVLLAVPFDPGRLEVRGGAVAIVQGVRRAEPPEVNTGAAHFAVSDTGSLIYVPGFSSLGTGALALLDRKGNVESLKLPPGSYGTPRISPDGKRIAYSNALEAEQDIYVHELFGSSSPRRLTFGGQNRFPVWSADGVQLAFQSDREGDLAIFWQRADGTAAAERLTKPDPGTSHIPESWSPSGETLLFASVKNTTFSSWAFSLRDRKAEPFGGVQSSFVPDAVFSPDGQWVAYRSAGPGPSAVYLQPFPSTGVKYEITTGASPVWSHDGKEIFVASGGGLAVLSIATRPSVTFGNRAALPTPVQVLSSGLSTRRFDITPDGRLLGPVTAAAAEPGAATAPRIHVVLNWFEELKARVPAR